jgi:uncharacterized protein
VYDPRYLAGVLLFNNQDFFEAHEVWEDLWAEAGGGLERKFYQGLIQAAVGLCHFGNGNLRGAVKLFHSSRAYLQPCGSPFLGLDVADFWVQMERCYGSLLTDPEPDRSLRPDPERFPVIRLDPAPAVWPDPEEFVPDDEED